MRANDFLVEKATRGKVPATLSAASPGARTSGRADRYYGLYRLSMLMGRYPENLDDIDLESAMGNKMYVSTYTQEEADMYSAACKAMGIPDNELIRGPSAEPEDTNKQSTIQPFKGYPR